MYCARVLTALVQLQLIVARPPDIVDVSTCDLIGLAYALTGRGSKLKSSTRIAQLPMQTGDCTSR
jgi:hypothetical protein